MHNVKECILAVCETSCCFLVLYRNTERLSKRRASVAPPTTPSMIARWLCTLCWLSGIVVT